MALSEEVLQSIKCVDVLLEDLQQPWVSSQQRIQIVQEVVRATTWLINQLDMSPGSKLITTAVGKFIRTITTEKEGLDNDAQSAALFEDCQTVCSLWGKHAGPAEVSSSQPTSNPEPSNFTV